VILLDNDGKPKPSQSEVTWQILNPSGHEHQSFQDVKQFKNTADYRGKYYIQNIVLTTPGTHG